MLLAATASPMSVSVTPTARIRTGSTVTEYCLTNPPTLATSDTPSARLTPKRTTQSCKDRNSASDRFSPFSAY